MQYRVEITARASRDLDAIYRYIHVEASKQAAAWFNGLHAALESLSSMPSRAPTIRENSSRRHLLYGTKPHIYRIIYFVNDETQLVTVLTIRHRAQSGT